MGQELFEFILREDMVQREFDELTPNEVSSSGIGDIAELYDIYNGEVESGRLNEAFMRESLLMLIKRNQVMKEQIYETVSMQ